MSINCPSCDESLRPVLYEGIRVQMCTTCKGFFLKQDDMSKIEQTREADVTTDKSSHAHKGVEIGRICPTCKEPMAKVKYGKISSTMIDQCGKCTGIWLDQGELLRIQADYELVEDNRAKNAKKNKPKSEQNSGNGFHCPKCNYAQEQSTQCVSCGIVFAKYNDIQQQALQIESNNKQVQGKSDDIFSNIRGFKVQQQLHLTEALIGFEKGNEYVIELLGTMITWHAKETDQTSFAWLGRNLLKAMHPFEIEVLDHERKLQLRIKRTFRLFFHHADVYDFNGKHLGSIQRRFAWLNRVFTINYANGVEMYRIIGPLFHPWTFNIQKRDREIGKIVKKWSGLGREMVSDADNFAIEFNQSVDKRSKSLFLGATFLIDFLYFESKGNENN